LTAASAPQISGCEKRHRGKDVETAPVWNTNSRIEGLSSSLTILTCTTLPESEYTGTRPVSMTTGTDGSTGMIKIALREKESPHRLQNSPLSGISDHETKVPRDQSRHRMNQKPGSSLRQVASVWLSSILLVDPLAEGTTFQVQTCTAHVNISQINICSHST